MDRVKRFVVLVVFASCWTNEGIAQAARDSATSNAGTRKPDSSRIAVFADGNVRGVMTGGTEQSTIASGSLGIEVWRPRSSYSAQVVIKSTVDTLTEDYGATLLSPIMGQSLQAGMIDFVLPERVKLLRKKLGIHGYLAVSQGVWANQDSASRVVVWSMGVMPRWDMEDGWVGDNEVRVSIEAGIGFRHVAGDISPGMRKVLLGARRKDHIGFESALEIGWNRITARIQPSWYIGRPNIRGLSGWQVAGSFGVRSDVFSGWLRRRA